MHSRLGGVSKLFFPLKSFGVEPKPLLAILIAATVPLSSCSYVGMQIWDWTRAPRSHVVAVIDAPTSMKTECQAVSTTIWGAIKAIKSNPNDRYGSRLRVVRTRAMLAGGEPELVLDEALPGIPLIGNRDDAIGTLARQARKACEGLPQGPRSPLALAVTRGLAHLRELDCGAGPGCLLIVHTDVREGRRSLEAVRRGAFDNSRIGVLICGFTGRVTDGKGAEHLVNEWRSLFKEPKRVVAMCVAERPFAL